MNLKTLTLAPVVIPQALWVAARATRLPEAAGARTGAAGGGPPLHLLIIGDSSAAGVGAETQEDALAGQLAAEMGRRFRVHWHLVARSGDTVGSTLRRVDAIPAERFDAALISLGVNDAKNGVTVKRWTEGYRHLLETVSGKFGARCLVVSGLPPTRHFPILPHPLNAVLGARTELFDRKLQEVAAERADTHHLPLDFPMDVSQMASDGFHPGPDVYRAWALHASDRFAQLGF